MAGMVTLACAYILLEIFTGFCRYICLAFTNAPGDATELFFFISSVPE
jgi:hypothetical protein